MVNRVLMWAAAGPRLQRQVTKNRSARGAAHRFVAGEGSLIWPARATPSRSTCRPPTIATRTWGAGAVPASGQAAESTTRPSGARDASIARAHRAPTEHRSG